MKRAEKQTTLRNMTVGEPKKVIISFAIPLIISNLLQQLYNITDNIIVGNVLGTDALAAVGCAGSITNVIVQLATGLSLGGSIIISQYFGAKHYDKVKEGYSTMTIFSALLGFAITFVLLLQTTQFLRWIRTPESILSLASSYLIYYSLGCIPVFIYNSLNAVYIALGDSRTPLMFLLISSILNIILDLLFLILLHTGIMGAALATVLSQLISMILAFIDLPQKLHMLDITDTKLSYFNVSLLKSILRYAIPSALQQSIVSIGSVVVQATINTFGPIVMAACTAASKIVNLATTIPMNFSNAYSNYVAQNIGANKQERIAPGLKASLVVCLILSGIMTILLELFRTPVIQLFLKKDDPVIINEVVKIGSDYVAAVSLFLVVFSVFMLMKATFKGSGDMGFFIFSTLLSFFIRLFLTVGFAHRVGIQIIWWSIDIGWLISLIVTIIHYYKGNWKKASIIRSDLKG